MIDCTGQSTGNHSLRTSIIGDLIAVGYIAYGELPHVTGYRCTDQAHNRVNPTQVIQEGLIRRATEDITAAGAANAIDLQTDRKRCCFGDGKDFSGDCRNINEDTFTLAIQESKGEKEIVPRLIHSWIKSGTLAGKSIEMICIPVSEHALTIQGRDRLYLAIRKWIVGFVRQTERIIEEPLFIDLNATFNKQWSANGVDPLCKGREHEGIATVDKIIING